MNHSIYSADRTTHLKIVVVALVAGIAGRRLRHLGAHTRRMKVSPRPRTRDEGRQAGGGHELGQFGRSLKRNFTNSRGSLQPPKVAT